MHELFQSLLVGASLLLIVEGILPFLVPDIWRKIMFKAIASSNLNLRILGSVSMLLGLFLLYLVRS
ncbi:DUF2065 family protein [Marinomonas sp. 2405UD68-3]|uniref:DUF2065 family protein n=1 Tax=Marinomonas sp. 2405UD68-3 TaxID=3391835 RepID=UPI0039C97B86